MLRGPPEARHSRSQLEGNIDKLISEIVASLNLFGYIEMFQFTDLFLF